MTWAKRIVQSTSLLMGLALLSACESDTQSAAVVTDHKQNTILSRLSSQQQPVTDTVAIVNGKLIQRSLLDYYILYKKAENPKPDASSKASELTDQLINIEVLAQYAEKKGLHKDIHIENRLRFEQKNTLANIVLNQALGTYTISEKDLKNKYNKLYLNSKTIEYKARHILVQEKPDALKLVKLIKNGSDFGKLAKVHSISPSAPIGGALEWFSETGIDKDFITAVSGLKKGAFTNTPVRTLHGWNIILLEDTREAPAPKLESVRDKLENALFEDYIKSYISDLRKKSSIEKMNQ